MSESESDSSRPGSPVFGKSSTSKARPKFDVVKALLEEDTCLDSKSDTAGPAVKRPKLLRKWSLCSDGKIPDDTVEYEPHIPGKFFKCLLLMRK